MLSESIRRHFLQFCAVELEPLAFEAWICAADGVESQIGHTAYLDLVSADYQGRDVAGMLDLCKALLEQHHPGSLNRYRSIKILESMLKDDAALLAGLRQLVALRHEGCEFIPDEFVGFESETDAIPSPAAYHLWDPAALAELLGRGAPYLKLIKRSTQEFLDDLRRAYPDDV